MNRNSNEEKTIVFFDGVCGLCNFFVDRLLSIDKKGLLLFSPLQGETAKAKLSREAIEDLDSMVVADGSSLLTRSDAVIAAMKRIGGLAGVFASFMSLFPHFLRDAVYKIVASNRYKIFGKRDVCRLPTKEERARFLP